ncbi:MAG: insulinase family protein [Coriobacteriaceae bacterium]|jgi:Zn-dependent M16 (insulinase) family peptidase|nr:insulinase family protein [Coriobacteriaceae bacterium]
MDLRTGSNAHGFTIEESATIGEFEGEAYRMRHAHSGARLLYLKTEDENKAFSITFKTPPRDDTGVFHILEHSVLCGSRKFPVKEPFVNLLKSSMQTFLNAMTFPDKTMYPVSSTNEQDLLNLMDVYMDAVLHPRIYEDGNIFKQEGWHYELDSPESALRYNGVVFNEMKGALSDPDSVLYNTLCQALFPDTAYSRESGGDPTAIPGLSYEDFLDAHRRHYRLDNSYLFLYGDLDIDRVLSFLDSAYLSPAPAAGHAVGFPDNADAPGGAASAISGLEDAPGSAAGGLEDAPGGAASAADGLPDDTTSANTPGGAASAADGLPDAPGSRPDDPGSLPGAPFPLELQEPLVSIGVIKEMQTSPENACQAIAVVAGHISDRERMIALDILMDALMGSNEAPLKRALLDAHLADDAHGYLVGEQLQPLIIIQLKGSKPHVAEEFRALVASKLEALCAEGIPANRLEASLSHAEFTLRERDFGMSDGVVLAMQSMAGWLYDDSLATAYLRYEDAFARLRKGISQGYFERLLRESFLEASHKAHVEIVPVPDSGDALESLRLAAIKEALTAEECHAIIEEEAALRRFQEAPDSPEGLASLPLLRLDDIKDMRPDPCFELLKETPLPCLYHHIPTRQINYAYHYFDIGHLDIEDLFYVGILMRLLGKLDTAHHTADELDYLTQAHLGALRFFVEVYGDENDPTVSSPKLVVGTSALSQEVGHQVSLPAEIWSSTSFGDASKIKDILQQIRIALEQDFINAGHNFALSRCASYYTKSGIIREQLAGIDFYRQLRGLLDRFDDEREALARRLDGLLGKVFTRNVISSFTGSITDRSLYWEKAGDFGLKQSLGGRMPLKADGAPGLPAVPDPLVRNEAFVVPTDICFTAKGYDRRLFQTPYSGLWHIAGRILSYDYLWNEVRVKGGAYGAGFRANRSGSMAFHSYRDPNLDDTLRRFDGSGAWLASFAPDEDALRGYIISSVAGFDAPTKPRETARRQDAEFFGKVDPAWRGVTRKEILDACLPALRGLSPVLDQVADKQAICVFGSRSILEASTQGFEVIDLLA